MWVFEKLLEEATKPNQRLNKARALIFPQKIINNPHVYVILEEKLTVVSYENLIIICWTVIGKLWTNGF